MKFLLNRFGGISTNIRNQVPYRLYRYLMSSALSQSPSLETSGQQAASSTSTALLDNSTFSTTSQILSSRNVKNPVIAIVGTTGVGKSKLAIHLASKFNGVVINTDSMQIYRGLDTITNKPTWEERQQVSHMLFDYLDPSECEYTVGEYTRDAIQAIRKVHSQGKVPVLVGGTHYYMNSLLWNHTTIVAEEEESESPKKARGLRKPHSSILDHPLFPQLRKAMDLWDPNRNGAITELDSALLVPPQSIPSEGSSDSETSVSTIPSSVKTPLWELLNHIDPISAQKWHPSDLRKIHRSLAVFYETGRKQSDIYAEQEIARAESSTLRCPTLVFWLFADRDILNPRLDDRVEEMIKGGLFDELEQMKQLILTKNLVKTFDPRGTKRRKSTVEPEIDSSPSQIETPSRTTDIPQPDPEQVKLLYTQGLFQAIGFKEFHDYLWDRTASSDIKNQQKQAGIEALKLATRQYARSQVAWIRNKFGPACLQEHESQSGAFYVLNATDLSQWQDTVSGASERLTRQFLINEKNHDPFRCAPELKETVLFRREKLGFRKYVCDICLDRKTGAPKLLNGEKEWQVHLQTTRHKKNVSRNKQT